MESEDTPTMTTRSPHLIRSGLTTTQCERVRKRVGECLGILSGWSRERLEVPEITFDLPGTAAGQYRRTTGGFGRTRHRLRFNPYLLVKHFDEGLATTVPHEAAHYAVAVRYRGSRVSPHGSEWREAMALLGAPAEVTHALDVSDIPRRRQRHWTYRCACAEHCLSTTRHHRVLQGARYYCRRCRDLLVRVKPRDP
jgi:SprT protein